MGIGDPADPVASTVELNNPVSRVVKDKQDTIDGRLKIIERSGNTELLAYVRYVFETLAAEGALTGDYTFPPT